MPASETDCKIYVAFRFHVNFYHSYRGDTPDELGFGKDIRIIRNTIAVLDRFNSKGVPACGTWDIENYFSLEKIMPEHCPDIIESLKRRVVEDRDEVQVMSYNNGLISAHTAAEFDEAIKRAITNAAGSGLRDIFGRFGPMVRPQEMMYTPVHLKMYRTHGVNSISLFYSAVPFNAFSNFIKPLPFEQRFNPLTLTFPGIEESMTLVPAYNHGDIADNLSFKQWVKRLRRKQLQMAAPRDLLLLIDADADDEYWYGYNWPVVSRLMAAARGINGLIESICGLDYVAFTTPSEYVETHEPMGEISIGQDTADGSFDGLSSWSEKWSNHQLWTGVERSRILELQTRRLMGLVKKKDSPGEVARLLAESGEARLKSLSTTHFGLSSPVMNLTRLRAGISLVRSSVEKASLAFELAEQEAFKKTRKKEAADSAEFTLLDYVRGVSTGTIEYSAKPSRALVRVRLAIPDAAAANARLAGADGVERPCAVRRINEESASGSELLFIESMNEEARKDFRIDFSAEPLAKFFLENPASVKENLLENEFISLRFDGRMNPVGLAFSGEELAGEVFMRSAVNYAGRIAEATDWKTRESAVLANGLIAFERTVAEITFQADGEKRVFVEREYMLASGLPYLYVNTRVIYPETHSNNYDRKRALRLEREYDNNWREVMPCEIRPALSGKGGRPLRIWKHDYCDHVSFYDLDYGEFSKNARMDSFNNHITHGWIAVSDGEKGLLVAQTADVNASFAFCPMRTRVAGGGIRIFLNPFGTYYGRQFRYATAFSGLGKFIALKMADQLDPYAPSYNGRDETLSLLIVPYAGDEPPEEIMRDAEAFAYPYAMVSHSKIIERPDHGAWSYPATKYHEDR